MPKCNKCSTEIDPVSFHCICEDLAEFHCRNCGTSRHVSIMTAPSCHTCQQPMVERGYRKKGDGYQEPDIHIPLELPEGVDVELDAAWAGWEKFLANPPEEKLELTLRQRRRVQWYDRLIWKIDDDRKPKEPKETFWR